MILPDQKTYPGRTLIDGLILKTEEGPQPASQPAHQHMQRTRLAGRPPSADVIPRN